MPVYQPPSSGGSGSVATDTIWDAKGDLAAATGSDAAVRVAVGANGNMLQADSASTAGVKWALADYPLMSNVVSTVPLMGIAPSPATVSANDARAARVTIPITGTLHGLSWYVGVQSGNIDLGIYDTTVTTRNRLYSSGSTACAAANTWQTFDPNLAVVRGDQLDFVWAVNNATASIHRLATVAGAFASMPTSAFWTSPLGGGFCSTGVMALSWSRATTFPLPSTLAESGLLANGFTPIIIAYVTPA